jgi:hypothetical protein
MMGTFLSSRHICEFSPFRLVTKPSVLAVGPEAVTDVGADDSTFLELMLLGLEHWEPAEVQNTSNITWHIDCLFTLSSK